MPASETACASLPPGAKYGRSGTDSGGRPPYSSGDASVTAQTARIAWTRQLGASGPLVLVGLAVAAEIVCAAHALFTHQLLSARGSAAYVVGFGVAAGLVAVLAISTRLRWAALLGPTLIASGVVVASAALGGQALSMLAAVLSMTAAWYLGRELLQRLGAHQLADRAAVSWLSGIGPLSLLTLLLGHLSLLKWWTIGLVVMVLGLLGLLRGGTSLWKARREIARELTVSPVAVVSAGMILLTAAVAAIYTAAPEIQFDPLYGKAYLPLLWAHTGSIGRMLTHPQLNETGWFQMLASWGDLIHADATGRYLQLIALAMLAAAIWSWARRFGTLGPLAAVVTALTPMFFWQATTADDDLLLALATFAVSVAAFELLHSQRALRASRAGLVLGLLVGTCASLKTFLVPLGAVLLLGWIVSGRRANQLRSRLAFGVAGALITGAPPVVLRWIDTGNPVFPAYNNVFRSPYWLPINETWNFPFWPHAGLLGPFKAVWEIVFNPGLMNDTAPPGVFGVLAAVLLAALLVGWRQREARSGTIVLWLAVVLGTVVWWHEFRYLRYLLPEGIAAVVLLVALSAGPSTRLSRHPLSVAVIALGATATFSVALAQFWNVPNSGRPPISAAIGRWSAANYLSREFAERPAILAFNSVAPAGARMVTDAFQRVWLTDGRDLFEPWEATELMQLHGGSPSSGPRAFARLSAMNIRWVLVDDEDPKVNAAALTGAQRWLPEVVASNGEPRFAAAGWELYQLVRHPVHAAPVAACDRRPTATASCWSHAAVSGVPYLTRSVPACPGQTLQLSIQQSAGAQPVPVSINFSGAAPTRSFFPGITVPGATQLITATVPAGSTEAIVDVGPAATVSVGRVTIGRIGPPCAD